VVFALWTTCIFSFFLLATFGVQMGGILFSASTLRLIMLLLEGILISNCADKSDEVGCGMVDEGM